MHRDGVDVFKIHLRLYPREGRWCQASDRGFGGHRIRRVLYLCRLVFLEGGESW